MDNQFDAIVVGSGFGGAVMASELASAGQSVCVLERGRKYPPGSFARSPRDVAKNFWNPSDRLFGMFDIWSFRHSEAVVASGLGGGSLIYANVLLRKPRMWFVHQLPNGQTKPWPVSYDELAPHYGEVEKVLGGQRFPIDLAPFDSVVKSKVFDQGARQAGMHPELPMLAVTFGNPGDTPAIGVNIHNGEQNLHGLPRLTCKLCGECNIGCNFGSKNTLDFNYLSLAARQGAELRTLAEVKRICPRNPNMPGDGYEVFYVQHEPDSSTPSPSLQKLTCKRLILAAGTLGTNYLLLKNRDHFPKISKELGRRYSTNGDLLAFAMCCNEVTPDGILPRNLNPSRGPVITQSVQFESGNGHRYLIQDAGYPEFVNWLVEYGQTPRLIPRIARFVWSRVVAWCTGRVKSEIDGELARLMGNARLTSSTMTLLGMGCDNASGRFRLRRSRRNRRDYLDVDWKRSDSHTFFQDLAASCEKLSRAIGGDYVENPHSRFFRRIVTVHPLGGCAMAVDICEGVVDAHGEVFNYPGLFVADGSVMPGPVGSNPSLTIAALSRRFSHGIISKEVNNQF